MHRRLSVLACVIALAACARPSADAPDPFTQQAEALTSAPQLVKDLRATSPAISSYPGSFRTIGSTTYFVAKTPATGQELWKTDGTAAGTQLVKDINPGADDSYPANLTVFGNTLYFTANEPTTGTELWKTDGTEAGTVLVKETRPGTLGFGPSGLVVLGGTLYFTADDGTTGAEPWKSDGTAAGTQLVKDISPGSSSSNAGSFFLWGNAIYFRATDATHGSELWTTDGTAAGTVMLKELNPTGDSTPDQFTSFGGKLLFTATDPTNGRELWTSDGTAQGTVLLKDIYPGTRDSQPASFTVVNGAVLFSADDGTHGRELWKTDGTDAGTVLVKDVMTQPSTTGSYLQSFTAAGNTLFFTALTELGNELWKSDGTAQGTTIVKDLYPNSGNADPNQLVAVGSTLYFVAETGTNSRQLYKTDGTAAGTAIVRQFGTSPGINAVTNSGGRLYFSADDGTNGNEPWTTDGTSAGTVMIADVAHGGTGGEPANFAALGSTLYFTADDGVVGRELWKSDGTSAGTALVKDVTSGMNGSGPRALTALNGALYFVNGYEELWKSDGTSAGTALVKNVNPNFGIDRIDALFARNGRLFFSATDGTHGFEPWTSDGTAAGTLMLGDLVSGTTGSYPNGFTAFNGSTWFFAYPSYGAAGQLFKTDGTLAGTVKVADVHTRDYYARPTGLVPFGNGMLFTASSENATGIELWATDGTAANTRMLVRIENGGLLRIFGAPIVVAGYTAFFAADDGVHGTELWATDGTAQGTRMVKDILPGTLPSLISQLSAVGSRVYFLAADGLGGRELWTSDGTAQGTQRVTDLLPGWPSGGINAPFFAQSPDGPLLFVGADQAHGAELWQVDPVGTAPSLLGDLAPGVRSSNPRGFVRAGSWIYFSADDGVHDRELWAVRAPTSADTTPPTVTCPASQSLEATSASGATASYAGVSASDDSGSAPTLTYAPAAGTTLPFGPTTVRVTATDDAGNQASCTFVVTVADTRAPHVTCPANKTVEATSSTGASATWSAATATDEVTAAPTITYSAASGSTFPLGPTQVTATAADSAGNKASCTFTITVADTHPPRITCPAALTAEATGPTGAKVTWSAATATDEVTAAPAITYSAASGSTFPLGPTQVTATATDTAGNKASCTFSVTVRDTTPPHLACPDAVTQEAADSSGARVTFAAPTATDLVTTSPHVTLDHASGSLFPMGATTVHATAADDAGNKAQCQFTVTVTTHRDRTAPVITCPKDLAVEATGPDGALVQFPAARATDDETARPTVRYDHASGSRFPLGLTRVTATATDAAGNSAQCSFRVAVNDTTPPQLTCPADQSATAADASGARVLFTTPAATDAVTLHPKVDVDPGSGSVFPVGDTTVSVTATDDAQNASHCQFQVHVAPAPKRASTGGCNAVGDVGALSLLALVLGRRRRA